MMSDPSHRFADVEPLDGLEIDADDIATLAEEVNDKSGDDQ